MKNSKAKRHPIASVALTLFFIVLCILFLIPLYALLLGTFKGAPSCSSVV